ncbi:hypothetical protein DPMN_166625 [Dreissena polymorpha]|uniref:Uncharacterized protein n=1 Tax=Dreissena polymorpha TaxID=45954 RepID=A0A9D4IUB5_DREPO|nr:hypothetical protein DPMN_166625 [Dreissena polymorpha]
MIHAAKTMGSKEDQDYQMDFQTYASSVKDVQAGTCNIFQLQTWHSRLNYQEIPPSAISKLRLLSFQPNH